MTEDFISKHIGDISIEDPSNYYVAPDCSIIRKFPDGEKGGFAHVTLPPRKISKAAKHKTVEELWYCLSGEGKFWRKIIKNNDIREEEVDVRPGIYLTIPIGVHFQFKNEKDIPLEFVIVDVPVWPGSEEADTTIDDHWTQKS